MTCRICLEEGDLIQPCNCTGTTAYVHEKCLMKWLNTSNRSDCEICKYEYEYVDVEEEVKVFCPRWTLAESEHTMVLVVILGFTHFVIMFFTSYWGSTTETLFYYGNITQGLLLCVLYQNIRPREVIVFWKFCSSMCLLCASIVQEEWNYFLFESLATLLLFLHTHVHLTSEYKQMVRYINIEDRSLNDEAVSRP